MRVKVAVVVGVVAAHVEETLSFLFPVPVSRTPARALRAAYDVSVALPDGGELRTVKVELGQNLLEALEAHDIDAPHSCRSGLCTE